MKKITSLFFLLFLVAMVGGGVSEAMVMDQLITIPTADLISVSTYLNGQITSDSFRRIEGIYLIQPKLEVGGMISNDSNESELGVSLKTLLIEESEKEPAISAGIKNRDVFFSLGKNLSYDIRGHLGIGTGELGGLYLGINKVINPVSMQVDQAPTIPIINLMAEYVDKKVNLGVRFDIQENMVFDLAVLDLEDFQIGMGFSF